MSDAVLYEMKGHVAVITINQPDRRNALGIAVRQGLWDAWDRFEKDPEARVAILTGTGEKAFCAGMDLKEAGGADANSQGVNEFPAILSTIWTSPKPVVAKLAGPARAGGVGIVAACDIAIAARTATFAFTEVRIGVIPAVISITVLPRLLPRAAHELFLTGETFDADRAVAVGLLNSSVPADELDAEVARYTGMLALGGPNALAATKQMLRAPRPADLDAAFAEMLALSAGFFASAEGQEGITAFAQKRPPSWVPNA